MAHLGRDTRPYIRGLAGLGVTGMSHGVLCGGRVGLSVAVGMDAGANSVLRRPSTLGFLIC